MQEIMQVIEWVKANWTTILEVYLAVVGLASVIVKLTPNKKDDAVLSKIITFVGKYVALNK